MAFTLMPYIVPSYSLGLLLSHLTCCVAQPSPALRPLTALSCPVAPALAFLGLLWKSLRNIQFETQVSPHPNSKIIEDMSLMHKMC